MGGDRTDWGCEPIQAGNLALDPETLSARLDGSCIRVTQQEFRLLALLARNAGTVLAQSFISNQLWDTYGERESRRLTVLVSRLRTQLKGVKPYRLETVRNRGYGFVLADRVNL